MTLFWSLFEHGFNAEYTIKWGSENDKERVFDPFFDNPFSHGCSLFLINWVIFLVIFWTPFYRIFGIKSVFKKWPKKGDSVFGPTFQTSFRPICLVFGKKWGHFSTTPSIKRVTILAFLHFWPFFWRHFFWGPDKISQSEQQHNVHPPDPDGVGVSNVFLKRGPGWGWGWGAVSPANGL